MLSSMGLIHHIFSFSVQYSASVFFVEKILDTAIQIMLCSTL